MHRHLATGSGRFARAGRAALLVAVLVALGAAFAPDLLERAAGWLPSLASGPSAAAPADPEIERTYAEAKALLDGYSGRTDELVRAGGLLEGILAKEPSHARAHVQLARVVYKLGHVSGSHYHPEALARARRLNDRALELDPQLPDAYVTGGYIALWQGGPEEARELAARAQALAPDALEPALLSARIEYERGNLDRAQAAYASILERAPSPRDQSVAQEQLAAIHCKRQEFDACEAAYRELIRLDPGSAWAKGNYAGVLVRLKKWDQAIAQAEAALAQMDYPDARHTLSKAYIGKGWDLLHARGPLREALDSFQGAIDADPANAYAHYGLGAAWYAHAVLRIDPSQDLAFLERAEEAYRKAAALEPGNATFKQELARLEAARRGLRAGKASW
jgi:Tfp pilus assembly protein PilF